MIRVDQLETLLRERDSELDRLKTRLLQQPNTRIEQDLQLRIDNLEKDNVSECFKRSCRRAYRLQKKLLETIEQQRKNADIEKNQQVRKTRSFQIN